MTVDLDSGRAAADDRTRRRRRPPEILTPDECLRLLAACGRGPAGCRNRAAIVLLWRAGLRVGEAIALRAADVAPSGGEIRVLHGKGDRARTVGMDPMAWGILEPWLQLRRRYPRPQAGPLLCTITAGAEGRELSRQYVGQAIARAAARAGIHKAVRPHGLRHTHAAELAREGVALPTISRQLGHASSAVTARYIDHLAPRQVIDAMAARPWPARAAAAPPPTP